MGKREITKMSTGGKKYYVVFVGSTPGLYEDWESAKAQSNGYPGGRCKSYPTYLKAKEAWKEANSTRKEPERATGGPMVLTDSDSEEPVKAKGNVGQDAKMQPMKEPKAATKRSRSEPKHADGGPNEEASLASLVEGKK